MSSYRGINKLRRTLRRFDDESVEKLQAQMVRGAQSIKDDAVRNFKAQYEGPSTGETLRSITYKISRDKLTAVIGPGAAKVKITKNPFDTTQYKTKPSKREAWNFFKGYWFELGTKGAPDRNIPPQRARPFMNPAYDVNKEELTRRVRKAVAIALKEAASGGTNQGAA